MKPYDKGEERTTTIRQIIYLRARLGDGTEVVDHVGLGHANASVTDAEKVILFVRGDPDEKLLFGLEDRGIGE